MKKVKIKKGSTPIIRLFSAAFCFAEVPSIGWWRLRDGLGAQKSPIKKSAADGDFERIFSGLESPFLIFPCRLLVNSGYLKCKEKYQLKSRNL